MNLKHTIVAIVERRSIIKAATTTSNKSTSGSGPSDHLYTRTSEYLHERQRVVTSVVVIDVISIDATKQPDTTGEHERDVSSSVDILLEEVQLVVRPALVQLDPRGLRQRQLIASTTPTVATAVSTCETTAAIPVVVLVRLLPAEIVVRIRRIVNGWCLVFGRASRPYYYHFVVE